MAPAVDILSYSEREWKGNTAKSALIRKVSACCSWEELFQNKACCCFYYFTLMAKRLPVVSSVAAGRVIKRCPRSLAA